MNIVIEVLKTIFLAIIEGITEWLPISSTGHMILVDELIHFNQSAAFKEIFFVVIQLGAIMAVVVIYFAKLWPFVAAAKLNTGQAGATVRGFAVGPWGLALDTVYLWLKIIVASIPAGIIGIKYGDYFNEKFYNFPTVGIMLIVFGILFLVVENKRLAIPTQTLTLATLSFKSALIIGCFQLIAAALPGTSRSGATIVGALLIGVSRQVATEFTFYMAIPAMFGASLLKLWKFGFNFTGLELSLLLLGTLVAFLISYPVVKFLINYIKTHDFKIFGLYRLLLGTVVLLYYFCR